MARGFGLAVKLSTDLKDFNSGINQAKQTLGGFKKTIGAALTIGAAYNLGKEILTTAGDFEHGMSRVKAITNATGEEFTMMRNKAIELGKTTQFSAIQASDALQILAMSGMSAREAVVALPEVLKLSAAGNIELAEAANLVTANIKAYGYEVSEATKVNDILANGAVSANNTITEFGEALADLGPIAKTIGEPIESVSAMVGILANKNIKGTHAATALGSSMMRLSAPTAEVEKGFKMVGLTLDDVNKEITNNNFLGLLEKLKEKLDGIEGGKVDKTGILKYIFGKHHAASMAAILTSTTQEIETMKASMSDYTGTAARVAIDGLGPWRKATFMLKSATEGLMISLGDSGLMGIGMRLIKMATNTIRFIDQHRDGLIKVTMAVGGLAAAIKVARLAQMAFNAALAANPIGLVLTLAGAAAAALMVLGSRTDDVEIASKRLTQTVEGERIKLDNLIKKITDSNTTNTQRKKLINQLNTEYSKYLPNIVTEKTTTAELLEVQKKVNKEIETRLTLMARTNAVEKAHNKNINSKADIYEDLYNDVASEFGPDKARELVRDFRETFEDEMGSGSLTSASSKFAEKYGIGSGIFEFNWTDIDDYKKQVLSANNELQRELASINAKFGSDSKVEEAELGRIETLRNDIANLRKQQAQTRGENAKARIEELGKLIVAKEKELAELENLGRPTNPNPSTPTTPKDESFLTLDDIKKELADLEKGLQTIENKAKLTGDSSDILGDKMSLLEQTITKLLKGGVDPLDTRLTELGQTYKSLSADVENTSDFDLEERLNKYTKSIEANVEESENFGSTQKFLQAQISLTKSVLKDMIVNGIDKESAAYKNLSNALDMYVGKLRQANAQEALPKLNQQVENLKADTKAIEYDISKGIWNGTKNVVSSISSMQSAFQNLSDDPSLLNWFNALASVIDTGFGIADTIMNMQGLFNELSNTTTLLSQKEIALNTAKMESKLATDAAITTSDTTATGILTANSTAKATAAMAEGTTRFIANKLSGISSAVTAASISAPFPANLAAMATALTSSTATYTAAGAAALTPFAEGGIVSGPTAALVGEYSGARNNPEVIAPLDKLTKLLQPQTALSGDVRFRIEGHELVGILNKETKQNSYF